MHFVPVFYLFLGLFFVFVCNRLKFVVVVFGLPIFCFGSHLHIGICCCCLNFFLFLFYFLLGRDTNIFFLIFTWTWLMLLQRCCCYCNLFLVFFDFVWVKANCHLYVDLLVIVAFVVLVIDNIGDIYVIISFDCLEKFSAFDFNSMLIFYCKGK